MWLPILLVAVVEAGLVEDDPEVWPDAEQGRACLA
jgi:hypothetical protein